MDLILPVNRAAPILGVTQVTLRKWVRDGTVKNVITNGKAGSGARYLINMTKEYGIERDGHATDCIIFEG